MIQLNSCGFSTQFVWPAHRRRCLNVRCRSSYSTRAEAIQHYKAVHSTAAIYCELCAKPVHTTYLPYWQAHCDKYHPNVNSPSIADSKSIEPSSAPKPPESTQASKATTKIPCPLVECSYKSRRMHKLYKHWAKMHPNFRFPMEKHRDDLQLNAPNANRTTQTTKVSADECISYFF